MSELSGQSRRSLLPRAYVSLRTWEMVGTAVFNLFVFTLLIVYLFPIVYMTGAAAEQWPSHGVPNSILLGKPFAPAQLVTAISQLLNAGGQPAS